jgi:hypothetical protein
MLAGTRVLAASLVMTLVAPLMGGCGSLSRGSHDPGPEVSVTTTSPATVEVSSARLAAPADETATTTTTASGSAAARTHGALLAAPALARPRPTLALDHAPAPASLFGAQRTWRIDGHVFPGISAMNDAEARALHGSYVMSYTSLVTPWERCDAPVSTAREATIEEWFASYDARELDDIDRATLHAKAGAKVMVHDLSCKDGTLVELVEVSSDELAIARDGVIFTASRVR